MNTAISVTRSSLSEGRKRAFSIEAIIGSKADDDEDAPTQRIHYDDGNCLRFFRLSQQRFDQIINRNCIRSLVSDIDRSRQRMPRIASLDPRILSPGAPALHRFRDPLSLPRDADGFGRVCGDRPFNFGPPPPPATRPPSVHPIPSGLIPWLSYPRTLLDPSSKQPLYYDWLISRPDLCLSSAMISGRGISKYLFLVNCRNLMKN